MHEQLGLPSHLDAQHWTRAFKVYKLLYCQGDSTKTACFSIMHKVPGMDRLYTRVVVFTVHLLKIS